MKKIGWFFTLLFVFVFALAACSSDEPAPAEPDTTTSDPAPAEDVPAEPTAMPIVQPIDTEQFIKNLGTYVLRPDDLPNEYRLPPGSETPFSNLVLIQKIGELQAKRYIDATGRLDGWAILMERTNKEDLAPFTFESTVEIFPTVEGAQLALTPDWFKAYLDEENVPNWVEGVCDLGDQCLLYYYETVDAANVAQLRYEVAFSYKNAMVWVMGRGLDIDVKQGYVLDAAAAVLAKIEKAP